MLDETGCDAVMVGRAALGNPWVIKQMVAYVEEGILLPDPTPEMRINQCLDHARRLMTMMPEHVAMSQMRGHAPWYMKGLKSSSYVKNQLAKVNTYEELKTILETYAQYLRTGDRSLLK